MEGDAGGGAGIAQFLPDHRVEAEIEARPAIALRHGRAEEACLARLRPERAIDDPVFFPAGKMGDECPVEEAAYLVAELLVFRSEGGSAGGVEHGQSLQSAEGPDRR